MKKVLFVATVTVHIKGFHLPYLKWLKSQGYEVHVASNGEEEMQYCDKHFNLPFTRNPISKGNIKAYKQLKEIIKDNNYQIIHCHTPVGGTLSRLASKEAREKGTKVIYTAHGFHFYKGASILNWIIYYPIEKYLSKYTDTIITINKEDYFLAKNKFRTKEIKLINGVGVNENKFNFKLSEEDKKEYRKEFKINKNDFIFISIGELNKNKNQIMQIKAMKKVIKKYKNVKLLIAGEGKLKSKYKKIIKKYKLEENIILIGYRKDIPKLLKFSNCLISTSKREGLPVNIIEGKFCNIPIIATKIRGHVDLLNKNNLIKINDINNLAKKMKKMILNKNKRIYYNVEKYKINNIINEMIKIYKLIRNTEK